VRQLHVKAFFITAILFFIIGFAVCLGLCGDRLQSERTAKDRAIELRRKDEARIEEYQRTVRNLTDQLKSGAETIERLGKQISRANTASGKAIESVGRMEEIIGRMETILGGSDKEN
jgi:hypothetical protein